MTHKHTYPLEHKFLNLPTFKCFISTQNMHTNYKMIFKVNLNLESKFLSQII